MSRKAAKAAKKLRLAYQAPKPKKPPQREKPIPKIEVSDLVGDFDLACSLLRVQFDNEWVLSRRSQPLVTREFAKGLIGVLTYKFPKHKEALWPYTAPVPRAHLQAWKQPEDELFQKALDNIRHDGLIEHRKVPYPNGFVLEYVQDRFNDFAATHVLFLEEYLVSAPPAGVIVGLPTSREVMFVRMDDPEVRAALNYLVWIVPEICMEESACASPYLYWWRDGTLSYLTARTSDEPRGQNNCTLPPEFLEVYNDRIRR